MTRLLFFQRHFEGNTHLNFNEIIHGTWCVISTLVKKALLFITTSGLKGKIDYWQVNENVAKFRC